MRTSGVASEPASRVAGQGRTVTSRRPQQHVPVDVIEAGGRRVASAQCFFSTWADDASGESRWRGFLSSIEPAGAVDEGTYELRLETGASAAVAVRELRTDGREQALFDGLGEPPVAPE